MITLVYLICNVSTIIFSAKIFLGGLSFKQKIAPEGIQIGSFVDDVLSLKPKVLSYLIPVMIVFSVSINSMVNPIVYVVRMAEFRAFVWGYKGKVTRTLSMMRMMIISMSTPAGTRPEEVQPGTLHNGEESARPCSIIWIPSIGNRDERASRLSSINREPISIDIESRVVRSSSMKGRHLVSPKDSKVARSWPTRKKPITAQTDALVSA